jgi:hypothetical protein
MEILVGTIWRDLEAKIAEVKAHFKRDLKLLGVTSKYRQQNSQPWLPTSSAPICH